MDGVMPEKAVVYGQAILERQLDLLLGWVRASESRLVFLLSLSTAMLSVITIFSRSIANWSVWTSTMAFVAGFWLALGIASCAASVFPRTGGPSASLIYFGGIGSLELEEYKRRVKSRTTDEYLDDLVEQCHINAKIAAKKYQWVRKSLTLVSLGFASWVVWLILLFAQAQ